MRNPNDRKPGLARLSEKRLIAKKTSYYYLSDQKHPATSEQLAQLYKLGYVGARPKTKQEAAELISKLLKSKRVKSYLFSTENGSEPYLVPMDKWPDPYKNDTEFRKELLRDWEKSEKRKEKLSKLRDL